MTLKEFLENDFTNYDKCAIYCNDKPKSVFEFKVDADTKPIIQDKFDDYIIGAFGTEIVFNERGELSWSMWFSLVKE